MSYWDEDLEIYAVLAMFANSKMMLIFITLELATNNSKERMRIVNIPYKGRIKIFVFLLANKIFCLSKSFSIRR